MPILLAEVPAEVWNALTMLIGALTLCVWEVIKAAKQRAANELAAQQREEASHKLNQVAVKVEEAKVAAAEVKATTLASNEAMDQKLETIVTTTAVSQKLLNGNMGNVLRKYAQKCRETANLSRRAEDEAEARAAENDYRQHVERQAQADRLKATPP